MLGIGNLDITLINLSNILELISYYLIYCIHMYVMKNFAVNYCVNLVYLLCTCLLICVSIKFIYLY